MIGRVIITGAGCGSADLMSLRALRALESAEAVVYDRLLGDGVEALIPRSAEKINAGKSSGNHTLPQDEINRVLLEKAKEGKTVVRLKGGDPFMFGRGGEEAEYLRENGIPFEIIPGISSAIAVPELAGIPVTHRGVSSSVHIMTGHFKDDAEINYRALVEAGGTLVFLMGLHNAKKIQNGLLEAGLDGGTPCAVIENGGTAKQMTGVFVLSELAWLAEGFESPSIIVVGGVCAMHDRLCTKRRLEGRRIVICRPNERAERLKNRLEAEGAAVSIVPSIRIRPLLDDVNETVKAIDAHDWTAFTSRTGVKLVFDSLFENGLDSRVFGGKKIAAIGAGTAEELRKYGIRCDLMPEKYYTEDLGELLVEKNADNILLFRAENGLKRLNEILEENGRKFTELYAYRTETEEEQHIDGSFHYAVFASPSEAGSFKLKSGYKAVCIGKRTLEAAKSFGLDCIEAEEQTDEGLFAAILKDVGL